MMILYTYSDCLTYLPNYVVDMIMLPNYGLFLQSKPVEEFYRARGKLLEFDLPGGIPESWPKLLQALNLVDHDDKQSASA